MQRLLLAFLFVTFLAAAIAYLVGRFSRQTQDRGQSHVVTTGGGMQRISFFLLICLMMYVSVSGLS